MAWALFLFGIALVIIPIVISDFYALFALAVVSMLAAAVVGTTKGTLLRVAKIKDGHAWLLGAGPEYLASLPKYVG